MKNRGDGKEFVVELRPLPESLVAVLIGDRLFVNDQEADKKEEAVAWARETAGVGKTHEIMWAISAEKQEDAAPVKVSASPRQNN